MKRRQTCDADFSRTVEVWRDQGVGGVPFGVSERGGGHTSCEVSRTGENNHRYELKGKLRDLVRVRPLRSQRVRLRHEQLI